MCRSKYFKSLALISVFSFLIGQNTSNDKKRKVYRTQSGSIIEAPKPLLDRVIKKTKSTVKSKK